MSVTYTDLTETSFPDSVDVMVRMSDMSATNKSLMDQYYTYINAGNFTSAQQLLTDNPTLQAMIINAAKINKFIDSVIAVERFFKNDVEGYLESTFAYIGTYSSGTTYKKGNIVDLNGESFICRVTSSIGVSPTAHTTTTNWAIIAEQGIQGVSGTGLAPRGAWDNTTQYYANDCVGHNNVLWQCITGNTNSEPTSSNGNWLQLLSNSNLVVTSSSQPTNQSSGCLWFQQL